MQGMAGKTTDFLFREKNSFSRRLALFGGLFIIACTGPHGPERFLNEEAQGQVLLNQKRTSGPVSLSKEQEYVKVRPTRRPTQS
jgi:hypothetical protein